jgi:hypothetical protein
MSTVVTISSVRFARPPAALHRLNGIRLNEAILAQIFVRFIQEIGRVLNRLWHLNWLNGSTGFAVATLRVMG